MDALSPALPHRGREQIAESDKVCSGAPVLEVSGRTYPVEIRYRPLAETDEDEAEIDMPDAIVDAADELARLGNGDILVFLPGRSEERRVGKECSSRRPPHH